MKSIIVCLACILFFFGCATTKVVPKIANKDNHGEGCNAEAPPKFVGTGIADVTYRYTTGEAIPEGWKVYEITGEPAWKEYKKCMMDTGRFEKFGCNIEIYPEYKWIIIINKSM